MKDNVLNKFVDELRQEEIDTVKFEQYINMFSRFLGYTNPDYKYNSTYLGQFIPDFIQLYEMLKKKNSIYIKMIMSLDIFGQSFEFVVDESFFVSCLLNSEPESGYISINKDKIVSPKLEIKLKFESENEEYVFCKEYDDYTNDKLPEIISDDVKKYMEIKKIREIENGAS